jgi:DNA-binding NarL/FixJ family response regulator
MSHHVPTENELPGSQAILIVDDHELVRMGLRSMLDSMGLGKLGIIEVGTLKDALEAYGQAAASIQMVVLDLNLPDSKGLSALQAFKRAFPNARVIVLSGSVDESIAEEARVLGAANFLHKTGDVSLIGRALRGTRSDPVAARGAAGESPQADKRMRLSSREVEILDLVLQGRSNQEIVDATQLKMGTVKNYISGLLVVFGVSSRSKLISLFR